ncbi:hypothetical protein CspeluHIS016_0800560 [Cutaneotrichosporon spelunceum]|uniref:Uncharacterized protein n=1 Tax=Cutaneotrichosporon spelunceum TaxID=1672016 RepID=A0AAD3YDQ1_9TREE|nr:hypothetical protein CspeluHIS016_0800560 [Cutaneotrichosporon spelunceum]
MRRTTLLLLAAGALALPAPVSPSSALNANVLAGQDVLQVETTTTTRRRQTSTTVSNAEATPTAENAITTPSSPPTNPSASPASHSAQPTLTPSTSSLTEPARSTNGITSESPTAVIPQSLVETTTTPGIAVVTEIMTVTANPAGQDNGAKVTFPNAQNYWVMHALCIIEWSPLIPVAIDIRLTHTDPEVLVYDYLLSSNVPAGFVSLATSIMEPAKPAKGYQLILADHENGTIYSTSEMFEIKKTGSSVVFPLGWSGATQSSDGIVVQSSGAGVSMWSRATGAATSIVALALGVLWL